MALIDLAGGVKKQAPSKIPCIAGACTCMCVYIYIYIIIIIIIIIFAVN